MSTIHWRGDAPAVAQETRVTPTQVEAGDQFTLRVGNKSVGYTASTGSVAEVTAALAAAWNSAAFREMSEVTATDDTTHLTLKADEPGTPFEVAATGVDVGGSETLTLTLTTPVASAGPQHWDTAANWSNGGLPADGDTVHIQRHSGSILYGLDQSAVTLAGLHIAASFTGEIGLPQINANGSSSYAEYRSQYLRIGSNEVTVGHGRGEGSSRLKLDSGTSQTTLLVTKTGVATDESLPPLLFKGTHANNALHMRGGHVGVAYLAGELAVLEALTLAGGQLEIGSGTVLTALAVAAPGKFITESAFTTLDLNGGEAVIGGAATATTINARGGLLQWRSAGGIGTLNITGDEALVDFSRDGRSRTVTNCTLVRGEIFDPMRSVSFTNGIAPGSKLMGRAAA